MRDQRANFRRQSQVPWGLPEEGFALKQSRLMSWPDRICACFSRKQKYSLEWKTKNLSKNKDRIVNTKDWGLRWKGGTIGRGKQEEQGLFNVCWVEPNAFNLCQANWVTWGSVLVTHLISESPVLWDSLALSYKQSVHLTDDAFLFSGCWLEGKWLEKRMGKRPELQGAPCLKRTIPIPPSGIKRNIPKNDQRRQEGHAFCLGVVSEAFIAFALLVGVLPVLRKWPDPALAT